MEDVIIIQDLESDPHGGNPLPTINLVQEGIPLSPDAMVDSDLKCEYESDPEYDDELRKVTMSQRCGQIAQKPNQEQKTTNGMMQMDPEPSELIVVRHPYACNLCGDGFDDITELGVHVRMHYDPPRVKSTSVVDSHDRAEPESLLTELKPITCKKTKQKEQTTKKVKPKKLSKNAMKVEPSAEHLPFRCSVCRFGFRDMIELSKHIRKNAILHSRKFEKYVCSTCSSSFRDFRHIGEIKKHIEEHTGVLPVDLTIQDNDC